MQNLAKRSFDELTHIFLTASVPRILDDYGFVGQDWHPVYWTIRYHYFDQVPLEKDGDKAAMLQQMLQVIIFSDRSKCSNVLPHSNEFRIKTNCVIFRHSCTAMPTTRRLTTSSSKPWFAITCRPTFTVTPTRIPSAMEQVISHPAIDWKWIADDFWKSGCHCRPFHGERKVGQSCDTFRSQISATPCMFWNMGMNASHLIYLLLSM